jgi:hypothetical protein
MTASHIEPPCRPTTGVPGASPQWPDGAAPTDKMAVVPPVQANRRLDIHLERLVLQVDPHGHRRLAVVHDPEEYGRKTCRTLGLERPAMKQSKMLESWCSRKGDSPSLTPRTFVRAAGFTNALIAAVLVVQFCVMALFFRAGSTLLVGVTLLLFLSLAIWITAAILGGVILASRWLWQAKRRHLGRSWPSPEGGTGVWDVWLDSPIWP